eukprot:CAMPEP_0172325480 /NCGR_PEP_ID=MMETSP1058-20130122/54176_1 /TAXON_ID=83371 /ORGANISM="Detonula confervacea, Strain CCMP 353" /LENGTH=45 /DNA_ID= /DNA_START= /DNA_END= /DNA_ORIENTATION=
MTSSALMRLGGDDKLTQRMNIQTISIGQEESVNSTEMQVEVKRSR